MKKVYILAAIILLTGLTPKSFAQKNEGPNAWLKTGSVLTYHLLNITKEYDFVVSDLVIGNDISLKWKMTEPVNYSGSVKMSSAAIDTATKIVDNFSDGSSFNMVDKTTIWLSRKLYKLIKSQSPAKINIDNKDEILNFVRNEKYPVKVDGVQKDLDVIVAESATGSKFWLLDNPQYPLIIKMELGFTIDLRSVETAK